MGEGGHWRVLIVHGRRFRYIFLRAQAVELVVTTLLAIDKLKLKRPPLHISDRVALTMENIGKTLTFRADPKAAQANKVIFKKQDPTTWEVLCPAL